MAVNQVANLEDKVPFDYIKGSYFRVIHVDGAIGSLTPSGLLHFALYSERQAIPRRLVHSVTPEGVLGEILPDETESRQSIIREMDVDAIMTIQTAKSIRDWLNQKIEEAEKSR